MPPLSERERADFEAALAAVDEAERALGAFLMAAEDREAELKATARAARARLGDVLAAVAEARQVPVEALRVDDAGRVRVVEPGEAGAGEG